MGYRFEGAARLEVPTTVDGRPARLVAYQSGDPGIYDELDVDLVTDQGTIALGTIGVRTNREDPSRGSDIHCYAYLTNGDEVSQGVKLWPSARRAEVFVEDHQGELPEYEHGMQMSGERMMNAFDSEVTMETIRDESEDVAGLIKTLTTALVSCGNGQYDYLLNSEHSPRVRTIGSQTFVGIGDRWANVTGDSLLSVAKVAVELMRGDLTRVTPRSALDELESALEARQRSDSDVER